ncbi:MAG: hypothetical protein ACTSXA_08750 [Candidatus Heimdallarchaeota archaeon]
MTSSLWEAGIDSLIHGLVHLDKFQVERNVKDLRFALISIDNAIELLFKKCLDDNGIEIMKSNLKTVNFIENLDKIRKLIKKTTLQDNDKEKLELFLKNYKIKTFHKDRNETFHTGSIKKESQLVELMNDVLESIQSFLLVFFEESVEQLNDYLSKATIVIYPLEEERKQLSENYGRIPDKQYLQRSYELLRKIIIYCADQIFDKKERYSNADLDNAIDKLKQIKEFKFTFLEDLAPTIKKKFNHVKSIYEFLNVKYLIDDELIRQAIIDINTLFSFFLEIYRYLEMGFIDKA